MPSTASIQLSPKYIFSILTAALLGFLAHEWWPQQALDSTSEGSSSGAQNRSSGHSAPLVGVQRVKISELYDDIEILGTLAANESVQISAKVEETVRGIHFLDGDTVEKGDLLVELDNREALAELAESNANVADAKRQVSRLQNLGADLASKADIDTALANLAVQVAQRDARQARVESYSIRAPFSGQLGLRQISPGSLVSQGTNMVSLDDLSTLKLDFTVSEKNLSKLHIGDQIVAFSSAWPGEEFNGFISAIDVRVDTETRSIQARAKFENPTGKLKPGMFLSARIFTNRKLGILIPETALIQTAEESYVYLVDESNYAIKREVEVQQRWKNKILISQGLNPDETIVTSGAFKLRPNTAVKPVEDTKPESADHKS